MRKLYLFLVILLLSSSCSRHDEVIALSKGFFYSLADTLYANPRDYYPLYDSLKIAAKSDMVEIDESNIQCKGDTIIVKCLNSYTSIDGTFKQKDILLFFRADKNKQFYICDSQGLIDLDKNVKQYGIATGALSNLPLNDTELSKRREELRQMLFSEYLSTHLMLLEKVKIQKWSWDTSYYSGEANGEARVVNNLDFAVDGIKYRVTYYDYQGNFMANDDGRISKTLYPGEKYNFTFWSSNAKYPSRARLELVFPEKLIEEIIMNKEYSGNEYYDYIKSITD